MRTLLRRTGRPVRLAPTLAGALAAALIAPLGTSITPADAATGTSTVTQTPDAARPRLHVRVMASGLDHVWDVRSIGSAQFLFTERDKASVGLVDHGTVSTVDFPSSSVWVSGETGLMGLEVDPDFADNRRFYTCQGGTTSGGGHDVRVLAWTLSDDNTAATEVRTLLKGFPATSGRHGGCRLLITSNGSLLVGTGDTAQTKNPRSLRSFGGKTLRLDRFTGKPWPTNRWRQAENRTKRYVHTFGHRNVQGLAERRDGTLWSVEQGTYRDDEVNLLRNGGDYGWQPGPNYDESSPMTDFSLPGRQYGARWSSGDPTLATSGGTFVYGKAWGSLNGAFAVCALKASLVRFLVFDADGRLQRTATPKALRQYGRIRTAVLAPNHDLLLTTDNADGNDKILRVSPR